MTPEFVAFGTSTVVSNKADKDNIATVRLSQVRFVICLLPEEYST